MSGRIDYHGHYKMMNDYLIPLKNDEKFFDILKSANVPVVDGSCNVEALQRAYKWLSILLGKDPDRERLRQDHELQYKPSYDLKPFRVSDEQLREDIEVIASKAGKKGRKKAPTATTGKDAE